MSELHLGFMSDAEIAEWCGKNLDTFKKKRIEWAKKQLIKYAEFEVVKKKGNQPAGFNINKIIEPIYSPSARKEVQEKWRACWGYNDNQLDSNKGCWGKLKPLMINEISDNTGANYISESKCEAYGSARAGHKREGRLGLCKYTYCLIIEKTPQHFDQEDYDMKSQFEKEYLKTTYID